MKDSEAFQYVSKDRHFKAWIDKEHAAVIKTLVNHEPGVLLARAQGRAQLLEEMRTLIEKADQKY